MLSIQPASPALGSSNHSPAGAMIGPMASRVVPVGFEVFGGASWLDFFALSMIATRPIHDMEASA